MTERIEKHILPHFTDEALIKGSRISQMGNGHINRTWLVQTATGKFVLQQVNDRVFPEPRLLINNLQNLHQHLSAKAELGEYQFQSIGCQPTLSGQAVLEDKKLGVWRALDFVDNSYSIDTVDSAKQAYQAAKAFGHFSAVASERPLSEFEEVIADFHNPAQRFRQLTAAVELNKAGRSAYCHSLTEKLLRQRWLVTDIEAIADKLPVRICHNDTKINNLLFDRSTHQVKAVIDLDTTMAGHLMYDFGDMVRTFCSAEAEDSTRYHKVEARADIFEAIVKGYLSELNEIITPPERQSLWLGALAMPLMLSVRFITDYLNGDEYFNVSRAEHNLQRARNQWRLFRSLVHKRKTLGSILFAGDGK